MVGQVKDRGVQMPEWLLWVAAVILFLGIMAGVALTCGAGI